MSTQLATQRAQEFTAALAKASDVLGAYHKTIDEAGTSALQRAVALSTAMTELRAIVTPQLVQQHIVPLMNTPLGFLTDKVPGRGKCTAPYDAQTIAECFIEALLHDAMPVNNEFNIIADRCYLTKNYFKRKTLAHPGVTEFRQQLGVPQGSPGGALVPARATWKQGGTEMKVDCLVENDAAGKPIFDGRIPIKVNEYMGADAILGKAERKLLARVYSVMTGRPELPEGDVIDQDRDGSQSINGRPLTASSAISETRSRLAGRGEAVNKDGEVRPIASTDPHELSDAERAEIARREAADWEAAKKGGAK